MKHYKLYPRERYATASTEHPATGTGPDACDSRRRPAPLADGLLSIGHISSPTPKLHVWLDGQRADFPAIPDLRPNRSENLFSASVPPPVRGVITRFSPKSRTRLQREMARINASQLAYTMALTLPGNTEFLSHELVMKAFKVIKERLASNRRFAAVSGFWKRELQERGQIHYHLILYGLADDSLRADFQAWVVAQWNSLLCQGLTDEQREHHRWFHSRPDNMMLIRSLAYFAKYVGQPDEITDALPGRWWGMFNKRALPFSERYSATLDPKAAILANRLARKRQQKRAEIAEHNAINARFRNAGFRDFELSQADIWRVRSGHANVRGFTQISPEFLTRTLPIVGKRIGLNKLRGQARVRSRRRNKTAPVIFTDSAAPKFAQDVARWVSKELSTKIELHETPYKTWKEITPCPLKPVPPGRKPVSRYKPPQQSDFLEGLRFDRGSRAFNHDDTSWTTRTNRRVHGCTHAKDRPQWMRS